MNKSLLQQMAKEGLSSHAIAKKTKKSQTTIKYWMKKYAIKSLHPFKKGGVRQCQPIINNQLNCAKCLEPKDLSEFYKRGKRGGYHSYCRSCCNVATIARFKKIKADSIEYKGGECILCGYNKCHAALEFHHLNRAEKDFAIGGKHISFNKIKAELDKCVLVCSNCHKEIHAGLIDANSLSELEQNRTAIKGLESPYFIH